MVSDKASFKVTKVEGDGESPTQTRKQMIDSLKGLTPGKPVLGAIGRDLSASEPGPMPENLTDEEKKTKRELKEFLFKYINPPEMGSKFKPEQGRAVLRRKLDKQTLGELRRFWAGKVLAEEQMTADKIEDLNRKWTDISP